MSKLTGLPLQPDKISKLASIRDSHPFCFGFIYHELTHGRNLDQSITKAASMDPSIAAVWNQLFEKTGDWLTGDTLPGKTIQTAPPVDSGTIKSGPGPSMKNDVADMKTGRGMNPGISKGAPEPELPPFVSPLRDLSSWASMHGEELKRKGYDTRQPYGSGHPFPQNTINEYQRSTSNQQNRPDINSWMWNRYMGQTGKGWPQTQAMNEKMQQYENPATRNKLSPQDIQTIEQQHLPAFKQLQDRSYKQLADHLGRSGYSASRIQEKIKQTAPWLTGDYSHFRPQMYYDEYGRGQPAYTPTDQAKATMREQMSHVPNYARNAGYSPLSFNDPYHALGWYSKFGKQDPKLWGDQQRGLESDHQPLIDMATLGQGSMVKGLAGFGENLGATLGAHTAGSISSTFPANYQWMGYPLQIAGGMAGQGLFRNMGRSLSRAGSSAVPKPSAQEPIIPTKPITSEPVKPVGQPLQPEPVLAQKPNIPSTNTGKPQFPAAEPTSVPTVGATPNVPSVQPTPVQSPLTPGPGPTFNQAAPKSSLPDTALPAHKTPQMNQAVPRPSAIPPQGPTLPPKAPILPETSPVPLGPAATPQPPQGNWLSRMWKSIFPEKAPAWEAGREADAGWGSWLGGMGRRQFLPFTTKSFRDPSKLNWYDAPGRLVPTSSQSNLAGLTRWLTARGTQTGAVAGVDRLLKQRDQNDEQKNIYEKYPLLDKLRTGIKHVTNVAGPFTPFAAPFRYGLGTQMNYEETVQRKLNELKAQGHDISNLSDEQRSQVSNEARRRAAMFAHPIIGLGQAGWDGVNYMLGHPDTFQKGIDAANRPTILNDFHKLPDQQKMHALKLNSPGELENARKAIENASQSVLNDPANNMPEMRGQQFNKMQNWFQRYTDEHRQKSLEQLLPELLKAEPEKLQTYNEAMRLSNTGSAKDGQKAYGMINGLTDYVSSEAAKGNPQYARYAEISKNPWLMPPAQQGQPQQTASQPTPNQTAQTQGQPFQFGLPGRSTVAPALMALQTTGLMGGFGGGVGMLGNAAGIGASALLPPAPGTLHDANGQAQDANGAVANQGATPTQPTNIGSYLTSQIANKQNEINSATTPARKQSLTQELQHLQGMHYAVGNALNEASMKAGFDVNNAKPEQIRNFLDKPDVKLDVAKKLWHDPAFQKKFPDLNPEQAMQVSMSIWDKMSDTHKLLFWGGLGMTALSMLVGLFSGGDSMGGMSMWGPMLGLGATAYGLSGAARKPQDMLTSKFWQGAGRDVGLGQLPLVGQYLK